ncbi:ATP-dependent DNA helicase DinG [Rheinheimera texasensis]|uniref:ATP-dependent DNA helicase DinG n=1 Tax=Rheinheimera texasensis TaxID=306205 RepID=UPI0004E0B661|nr:ATP-dependent DNA helicase DinG [Rheinheimera texasensis]
MLSDTLKSQIRAIHQQMKTNLPGYQPRPGQNQLVAEMANIVAGSYHSYDRIGLVEAGTGTGKSLAYLMAAIPLALAQKKTLVIATATVALQEQLVNKDLPFFQTHSGLDFQFSLVKGRQRYACIQRLTQQIQQPELFAQAQVSQFAAMQEQWKSRKWLGDRDSLSEALPEQSWQLIQADAYHCPRQHAAHRNCPFHLARAEIDDSQVLVVNHALLLADLDAGSSVLPSPEDCIYVIDEAHHLADVGRDYFSARALLTSEASLWQDKVQKLKQLLNKALSQHAAISELLRLADATDEFFSQFQPVQRQIAELFRQQSKGEGHLRFADAVLPELLQRQSEPLRDSSQKVLNCIDKLFQLLLESANDGKLSTTQLAGLQQELSQLQQKFSNQAELWACWSQSQQHVSQARWLEADGPHISGHASPLSVSFQLEDLLFSQAHAVLLCSATLKTLGSFDHISRDLGLTEHPGLRRLEVASPFAYRERGLIHIPKLKTEPTDDAFTDELCRRLADFLRPSEGNLVLFASYWQMEQVAAALRQQGHSLLVQGEASRQALLDLHKSKIDGGNGSILFGTQSFSEGLDLPGKLLTNLVITKLPFAVPTSPFEEAMAEAITKRGGNAFLTLTVPATARKLVQACGRLLRQEQDHGRIIILDRRLVTKSYGSAMLNALPPFQRQIDQ